MSNKVVTVNFGRRLVERDQVLFMFAPLGTAPNIAIQMSLNQKKVPQLFVASGASRWGDHKHFPWTMGWQPDNHTEGSIYAKHILQTTRDPKIAVRRQNDDFGMDYCIGFREGLGDNADQLIVKAATYGSTDPTGDSQMIQLANSGASVCFNITIKKYYAQAIKKAGELGWKPAQYLVNVAQSLGAAIRPAGFQNAPGIITAQYLKDATDPRWDSAPDMVAWNEWMAKYQPAANVADSSNEPGYANAFTVTQVLRQCGDELTRENIMKQAANLHELEVPLLLPGSKVNTGPDDFCPIESVHLARIDGEPWVLFGHLMSKTA